MTAAERKKKQEEKAKQEQYMRDVAAAMRQQANVAALNQAWAAANPGQASPNGTVVSPGTPVTSIDQLPAGSVDPALTYAMDAANRGVGYQNDDYNTQWAGFAQSRPADLDAKNSDGTYKYGRGVRDYFQAVDRYDESYGAAKADAAAARDRALADLLASRDRNLGDLGTQQTRNTEDLGTQYQRLGRSQLQSINQAGGLLGGALAQALAKRQAAQGLMQGRMNQDYATATGRLGEDYGTQTGRLGQDYNTMWGAQGRAVTQRAQSLADMLSGAQRGATDAYTTYQRGVGENAAYQGTLTAQAMQGAQTYLAQDPNFEIVNGRIYQRSPSGGVVPVPARPVAPTNGVPGSNVGRGPGGMRAPRVAQFVRVPDRTPSLDDRRRRPGRQNGGGGFSFS